jgi:hypothetical protein
MGKSSKAPNPVNTTVQQNELNRTNQNGPFANLSYSQSGKNADGTPQYTATSTLSPELQSLYGQVGHSNPALDPSNLQHAFDQQQQSAYNGQMSYLQPQFNQQTQTLTDKLAQQGITQASNPTAYANAMQLNSNQQDFARQQAYNGSYANGLAGANQQFNQGVTSSNLPISQLSALYGLSNQNGQSNSNTLSNLASQQYSANNATSNNMMGGLFNLGSTALTGYLSGKGG